MNQINELKMERKEGKDKLNNWGEVIEGLIEPMLFRGEVGAAAARQVETPRLRS